MPEELGIFGVIDNSIPPARAVASGEVVVFDCPGLPLPPDATVADLIVAADLDRPHQMVGPVEVEGAEPGDALRVDVLAVEASAGYGHAALIPGEGLLGDETHSHYLHAFEWAPGASWAELRPGVDVPLDPFCGILGVMPSRPGAHSSLPPRATGGNIDNRHLVVGACLWLPVKVRGALFFAGDGHAAQGDGEVGVSGLETAVRATLRLTVEKGLEIPAPRFQAGPPRGAHADPRGSFGTSAVGPDLYEASRDAIRHMVGYLSAERGLEWEEAMILCSLAVDLRITEVVDRPNWVVSAHLPLAVFGEAA